MNSQLEEAARKYHTDYETGQYNGRKYSKETKHFILKAIEKERNKSGNSLEFICFQCDFNIERIRNFKYFKPKDTVNIKTLKKSYIVDEKLKKEITSSCFIKRKTKQYPTHIKEKVVKYADEQKVKNVSENNICIKLGLTPGIIFMWRKQIKAKNEQMSNIKVEQFTSNPKKIELSEQDKCIVNFIVGGQQITYDKNKHQITTTVKGGSADELYQKLIGMFNN